MNASGPVAAQGAAGSRFLDNVLIFLLMAVAAATSLPRVSDQLWHSVESAMAVLGF